MWWPGKKRRARLFDDQRIRQAIAAAERLTSGEIRVAVAPLFWGNIERAAERAFQRLGMMATRERNGILFFVVPARRTFVIRGDTGIHARAGQAFWDGIAQAMAEDFRSGRFTEGLVRGIETAGARLAELFPTRAGTPENELRDEIDYR